MSVIAERGGLAEAAPTDGSRAGTDGSRTGMVLLWGLVAGLAAAVAVVFPATGMAYEPRGLAAAAAVCGALMLVSLAYTRLRPDPRLARLMRGCAELFALTFLTGSLSYAASSLALPLWDEAYLAWDRALGFDWRDGLALTNAHPRLHLVLLLAYHSMLPQMVLAIVALTAARAWRELDAYLLALGLAAAVTVVVAAAMPALSPVVHLGITPADHPAIRLAVDPGFADQLRALRDGSLRVLDVTRSEGLVTFPSFHTAAAVLLAFAFWPIRGLRWAGLALNGLMLLAVPIEGSHYLVDLLAGVAVALAARGGARGLLGRYGEVS